jgi:hypothetical protein
MKGSVLMAIFIIALIGLLVFIFFGLTGYQIIIPTSGNGSVFIKLPVIGVN